MYRHVTCVVVYLRGEAKHADQLHALSITLELLVYV